MNAHYMELRKENLARRATSYVSAQEYSCIVITLSSRVLLKRRNNASLGRKSGSNGTKSNLELRIKSLLSAPGALGTCSVDVGTPLLRGGLHAAFIKPIVRIFMIYIRDMSKQYFKETCGLNPLSTDHAGRFPSGSGWFRSFKTQLVVYTQQNNENTHIEFRLLGLRR
jgi:hypothetical protein